MTSSAACVSPVQSSCPETLTLDPGGFSVNRGFILVAY